MFAYCNNNPICNCDPTGALAFPGEIHNEVVKRYAAKYALYWEQTISYKFGWGRADLISDSGSVWEVKPDNPRAVKAGKKQVQKYANNKWKRHPDIDLQVGDQLDDMKFDYVSGCTTYHVSCKYKGDGVIAYTYEAEENWEKVGQKAVSAIGAVVLLGITLLSEGATTPQLQQAIATFPE